jgi:GntR family transcriptional regulator, transcriptional repressor for pyruvate dehydrogenase complex
MREMSEQVLVEPIRRSRLSQQIVVRLSALIREGRLRAGDRLPAERELADQLRVSRSSLREALRTMELAGLVESRHGGGTYVRDAVAWNAVSPLALVLQASGDAVGDLWEIRLMVEPEIAARAALRATGDNLDELDELLARQAACLADEEGSLRLDRQFHAALAGASQNAVAVQVVELIGSLLQAGRSHFITSPERRQHALSWHREIVAAVRGRDPESARSAMRRHLQEVEAYIVGALVAESADGAIRPRSI